MFIGLEDSVLLRCNLATNCCKDPIRFQQGLTNSLLEIDKLILKCIWTCKGHRVTERVLKKISFMLFILLFYNIYSKLQKSRQYRIGLMIDIYNNGRQWRVGRPM